MLRDGKVSYQITGSPLPTPEQYGSLRSLVARYTGVTEEKITIEGEIPTITLIYGTPYPPIGEIRVLVRQAVQEWNSLLDIARSA
jgi:hypothetical protein